MQESLCSSPSLKQEPPGQLTPSPPSTALPILAHQESNCFQSENSHLHSPSPFPNPPSPQHFNSSRTCHVQHLFPSWPPLPPQQEALCSLDNSCPWIDSARARGWAQCCRPQWANWDQPAVQWTSSYSQLGKLGHPERVWLYPVPLSTAAVSGQSCAAFPAVSVPLAPQFPIGKWGSQSYLGWPQAGGKVSESHFSQIYWGFVVYIQGWETQMSLWTSTS